jgi:hypothetical protein
MNMLVGYAFAGAITNQERERERERKKKEINNINRRKDIHAGTFNYFNLLSSDNLFDSPRRLSFAVAAIK